MKSRTVLRPIKKNNIYEDVILHLKDYIVANKLNPGDRLPTEAELAESFNVSRLTVREAMKVLESQGVVQSKTRDGTRLRELTMKPAADHLRFLLDVEQVPVQEIAVARRVTECGMMPVIVANATPEDFKRIEEAVDLLQRTLDEGRLVDTFDAESQFHCALLKATRNRAIESFGVMLQEFFQYMQRRNAIQPELEQSSVDEHRAIYEALVARDADKATDLMRKHLQVYDSFTFAQGRAGADGAEKR